MPNLDGSLGWKDHEYRSAYYRKRYAGNPEKYKGSQSAWTQTPKAKFGHLRRTAKTRNCELSLSFEEYLNLIKQPCVYCGGALPKTGHGLDRKDNRFGYTLENSVPCCKRCNFRKGNLEAAGFKYPRNVELLKEILCSFN